MADSPAALQLDDENPWPGPAPYTEATQRYFHGRDLDSAELLRLIRLSPFVMLYGKSGLGKSSMLQAGVFPALRAARYLPVYLRLNFAEGAEPPLQQALTRLLQEIEAAAADAPVPEPGEGLWAYLQRRERPIWTADNFPLTPVLVFDQFEEVFSRSGSDEHLRRVLDDIADLVGDRLNSALAEDPEACRKLNLQSQQYRVVLSFRSDFLAEVESWERHAKLPKHEALHLKAMSRDTAIDAVEKAGAAVLAPGVAAQIVDFVLARDEGGSSLASEVEPVLLSLCCYQLNSRRQRPQRIDSALLRNVGKDILLDFYRGALAGTEPRVSVFIEDNLIQGGYRGSFPRDEALASGALRTQELETLTERRLLRVDPQGDVPRIELIHDRLVGIVRDAREARLARERQRAEQEELERLAEDQRERERLKQTMRSRNRLGWALVALLLALVGLGFVTTYAFHEADRANEATARAKVEEQRAQDQAASAMTAAAEAAAQKQRAEDQARIAGEYRAKAESEREAAEQQKQLALAAELRAHASARRAEGLRLMLEGQAMLGGTKAGGDALAYQLLLAGRDMVPDKAVDGRLFEPLVSRQHLRGFTPVVLSMPSDAITVAFSPDGRLLAIGHRDGSVSLRDLARPQASAASAPGHQDLIQSIAFSPDGRRLVSASNDGQVRRWQVQPLAAEGAPLRGHRGAVYSAAFSPDGKLIVSSSEDGTLRFWQADSGAPDGEPLALNSGPVYGATFHPTDGRTLLAATGRRAGGGSHLLRVDVAARQVLPTTFYAHQGDTLALALGPSGRQLLSGGSDGTLRLRELEGEQAVNLRISAHERSVQSVAISPDGAGRWLASGGVDGKVRLWDGASGQPMGQALTGHRGEVSSVSFSPDGRWLASAAADGSVRLWPLDGAWSPLVRRAAAPRAVPDVVARDGQWLVAGQRDGSLEVEDRGAAESRRLAVDAEAALGAALVPCRVAERATRAPSTRGLPQAQAARGGAAANAVAGSGDGRWLVSAHQDGTLRWWDAQLGRATAAVQASDCALRGVARSADGQRIATVNAEGELLVFDAAGRLLGRRALPELAEDPVLALSTDGRWLAAATGGERWQLLLDLTAAPAAPQRFHDVVDAPASLAFSADGEHLVSGSQGGLVQVWNRRELRPLSTPVRAHAESVAALSFSADGNRFYSVGRSGTVRSWPAPNSWVRLMCDKLDSNLSRKQWREWVSSEMGYRCSCPGLPIAADDAAATRPAGSCRAPG